MNAQEARKLANENGFDQRLEKEIKKVERKIKDACEYGRNSTCFGMLDQYKNPIDFEVKKHFKKLGYTFKPTGYVGGVYQHTEDICW